MQVKLRVVYGNHAGKEIRVPLPQFVIGRGEQCHLRPASDVISRKHCALVLEDHHVVLHDFGSKNGTYVNGEQVDGTLILQAGDVLQVGPLKFELIIEQIPQKRTVVKDVKAAAVRAAEEAISSEDDDITNWLEGPQDAEGLTQSVDSRIFKLDETQQIDPETSEELANAVEEESGKKKRRSWKKADKSSRKILPTEKLSGADSREAASDTLRKFFNRR